MEEAALVSNRASVQLFLLADVSEGADVGQCKAEAELIFITHSAQREAAIFQADPAAIPVVAGLHGCVLQKAEVGVETEGGCPAKAALVGMPVAEQDAELIEILLEGGCADHARQRLHVSIAAANGVVAEVIVEERRARIDAMFLEVVIDIPFGIGLRAGLRAKA